MTALLELTWIDVCDYDELLVERGTRALVGGRSVALFRLADDSVHALSDLDPFSGASVLSRGVVGTLGETPVVASPMYKQHFDLRTGGCIEDHAVTVEVLPVRVMGGRVLVGST